jgi:hypothetical protein
VQRAIAQLKARGDAQPLREQGRTRVGRSRRAARALRNDS